jgi:hypothetical protein
MAYGALVLKPRRPVRCRRAWRSRPGRRGRTLPGMVAGRVRRFEPLEMGQLRGGQDGLGRTRPSATRSTGDAVHASRVHPDSPNPGTRAFSAEYCPIAFAKSSSRWRGRVATSQSGESPRWASAPPRTRSSAHARPIASCASDRQTAPHGRSRTERSQRRSGVGPPPESGLNRRTMTATRTTAANAGGL